MSKKPIKEDSEAADTLKPNSAPSADPKSRLEIMNAVVTGLNQLPAGVFYDNAAKVVANIDSLRGSFPDTAAALKATISVKEEVEAMFAESDLSEEGKVKAANLFEAAVNAKVQMEVARLEDENDTRFDEEMEKVVTEVVESLDAFLADAVDRFMSENEVAIESTVQADQVTGLVAGLKALFTQFNIDLPAETIDAIDAVKEKNTALESRLSEALVAIKQLKEEHSETDRDALIASASEGMTVLQKDKFVKLAETLEYTDPETFAEKLVVVRENFFGEGTDKTAKSLDESTLVGVADDEDEKPETLNENVNPTISALAKFMGRSAR